MLHHKQCHFYEVHLLATIALIFVYSLDAFFVCVALASGGGDQFLVRAVAVSPLTFAGMIYCMSL